MLEGDAVVQPARPPLPELDPLRTNAYTFAHNGYLGFPVAKAIDLPGGWQGLFP